MALLAAADAQYRCCLCSRYVTQVQFADNETLLSSDSDGQTKVWDIATGEEKTKALAGSQFALSKQGNREQQAGRFLCTAHGDWLLIDHHDQVQAGRFLCTAHGAWLLIHHLDQVEKGGTGKATTAERAPFAFFEAPSRIQSLDCIGADIALGCESGEVVLLRAAVLLT